MNILTRIEEISKELREPLDRKHVQPPPKGKYGDYIFGWHVFAEMNRIFGWNAWGYTIERLELTNHSTDAKGKYHIGYLCVMTLHLEGCPPKTDVGHGQGHGTSEGDAHDSAVKEAVTDAFKRCARTYGAKLGLALYDKEGKSIRDVEEDKRARDKHMTIIRSCGNLEDLQREWANIYRYWGDAGVPEEITSAKDEMKEAMDE